MKCYLKYLQDNNGNIAKYISYEEWKKNEKKKESDRIKQEKREHDRIKQEKKEQEKREQEKREHDRIKQEKREQEKREREQSRNKYEEYNEYDKKRKYTYNENNKYKDIDKEYIELYETHKDKKKVIRILSLKYHPDKNNGLTVEKQKYINNLKENESLQYELLYK